MIYPKSTLLSIFARIAQKTVVCSILVSNGVISSLRILHRGSTSQNRHLRVIDRVPYCLILEHMKKLLTFGFFSRQIKVIYQRSTSTTQLFTWVSYDRHRSQPVFHNSKAPMGTLKSIQRRMWHFSRIFWRHGQLNTI